MINVPHHPNYHKNSDGMPGECLPCVVCGKPIKMDTARYTVHLHDGGSVLVTEAEAATMDPSADLGCYPIGADCLRRHPELRSYVQ
jgi:hypothetical protein